MLNVNKRTLRVPLLSEFPGGRITFTDLVRSQIDELSAFHRILVRCSVQ